MRGNIDESVIPFTSLTHKFYAVGQYFGDVFDRKDYEEILVVFRAGTHTPTGTVDVILQDSDTGTGLQTISGATFTQVTDANDESVYYAVLRPRSTKRFIRAVATVGTADCNLGVAFYARTRQPPIDPALTLAFTI